MDDVINFLPGYDPQYEGIAGPTEPDLIEMRSHFDIDVVAMATENLHPDIDIVEMATTQQDTILVEGTQDSILPGFNMRYAKIENTLPKRFRLTSLSSFVQGVVGAHNEEHAVREHQLVPNNLLQARSTKIKGRGKYKSWNAAAALRVCFGRMRIGDEHQPRNPTASSARSTAAEYEASRGHIQSVPNAISHLASSWQSERFNDHMHAQRNIFRFCNDETEHHVYSGGDSATYNVMMQGEIFNTRCQ